MPDKNIHRQFKTAGENALYIHCRGILPILLLDIYTYQNTRSVLIQKAKESEMDGLNMIADSMSESMSVISDISKQMYFDEKIEHIAFHSMKTIRRSLQITETMIPFLII